MSVPKASVAASRLYADIGVPRDHHDHAPDIVDRLNEVLTDIQAQASATLMWQQDVEGRSPFIRVVGNSVNDLKRARNNIQSLNLVPWMQKKPHAGMRAIEYRIPSCHEAHMNEVVANLNQAILSAQARIEPGQDGQFRLRIEADSPRDLYDATHVARDLHIVPWLL